MKSTDESTVRVLNPDFKYTETRKPNKILVSKEPWRESSYNGITGLPVQSWSVNTGIGLEVGRLPKATAGNVFTPYHG